MLDTLNLTELIIEGELQRKQRRRRYRNMLIGLLIAIVIPAVITLTTPDRPGDLYVWQDNQWRVEELPGGGIPHTVQVSNTGQMWVNDWLMAGIYHRDPSGHWQTHHCHTYNTECGHVYPFTTDGDEFWGVVYDNIIHFDGENWTNYDDVLPSNYSAAIATGKDGIAVLSYDGQLSMFDGETGQSDDVVDVLPFIEKTGDDSWGTVVTASDGAFWLAYYGFWRYDGEEWKLIKRAPRDEAEYYRIMGVEDKTIWFSTGYELIEYDAETRVRKQAFSGTETGQAGNATFNITAREDELWLATDKGIRHYDGQQWGKMSVQPPTEISRINSVSTAPDGTLWATVVDSIVFDLEDYDDESAGRTLIAGIATLFGTFYILIQLGMMNQIPQKLRQSANERLLHLFPDFVQPEAEAQPTPNTSKPRRVPRVVYSIIGVVIFIFLLVFSQSNYTPTPPSWVTLLIFIIIGVFALRWKSFEPLVKPESTAEQRLGSWQIITQNVLFILLGTGIITMTSWFGENVLMISLSDSLIFTVILVLVGLFIGYNIYIQLLSLPSRIVFLTRIANSDYDGAVKLVDKLDSRLRYLVDFKALRGLIALYQGDFVQAEAIWYALASQNQQAMSIANLGFSYLDQKRFEEALALFSYCVEAEPMIASRYWLLLDYYIKLDQYPERTLEISDTMLRFSHEPRLSQFFRRDGWIKQLDARAWILAKVGRYNEAEALIHQALQKMRVRFNPTKAALYNTMGYIKEQRGHFSEAGEYYDMALKLDPNGDAGQKAREKLAQLAV